MKPQQIVRQNENLPHLVSDKQVVVLAIAYRLTLNRIILANERMAKFESEIFSLYLQMAAENF